MFAQTATPQRQFSALYRRIDVDTGVNNASPHKLVCMLFDGLCDSMDRARGAIAAGDVVAKGQALGRAVRIVEEGLRSALNLKEGGALANDLNDLYLVPQLEMMWNCRSTQLLMVVHITL